MLTLAEVLRMPPVRVGDPEILAAKSQLHRQVRWVHTTELADIGPLLRGGDLVLTTGIALPDNPEALVSFAQGLARSEAAGLLIELGRRWSALPHPLIESCETFGLPLVALRREVRFAAIAQAVGERLIDVQLTELREAQRVHETFTELSISEAGPGEILDAVERLAGAPVVLESEQHQILDYRPGPGDTSTFLDDWERRSRRLEPVVRTSWDASNGWLITRIGRRERGWGRLVIESPGEPSQRLIAVAERAAAALAMHRLHARSRDGHLRRIHQELLLGLLNNPADHDVRRRIEMTGMPSQGSRYIGLVLRPATSLDASSSGSGTPRGAAVGAGLATLLDELVAACLRAAELVGTANLVAAFEAEVRVLLAAPGRMNADRMADRFADQVRLRVPAVITAGTAVGTLAAADQTLREAMHVSAALPDQPDHHQVHRLVDVHLRGLLALLADDSRLQAFAQRELAPLAHDPELLRTVRVLVEHWGSKSKAATELSISRAVLYDRMAKIERLLGAKLSDSELRTSLHVALLTLDSPARLPGFSRPESRSRP